MTLLNIVDSEFARPPSGVRDPMRVVGVGSWNQSDRMSYPDYEGLRTDTRSFTAVGAFAVWDYTVHISGQVIPARGMLASQSLFDVLGAHPKAGRWFAPDEDRPGVSGVVLVSDRYWHNYYVGTQPTPMSTLELAGRTFTVIGILPPTFTAPDLTPVDMIFPITNAPWQGGAKALSSRAYRWLRVIGRLQPGITPVSASVDVTTLYRLMNLGLPTTNDVALQKTIIPVNPIVDARREPGSPLEAASLWLTILALLLLLIGCANSVGVLLARAASERRDIAVQFALGMPRWRFGLRVVLDVALLAVPGACLALWIAHVSAGLLEAGGLLAIAGSQVIDGRTLILLAVTAVTTIALCAAWPLLDLLGFYSRATIPLGSAMQSRPNRKALHGLVVIQVALAVVVISEAVLFGSSLHYALNVDMGVRQQNLLVVDIDLQAAGVSHEAAPAVIRHLLDLVSQLPGVKVAGITNAAVAPGMLSYDVFAPDGGQAMSGATGLGSTLVNWVTPDFIPAIGVRLAQGRMFSVSDAEDGEAVALVSEQFAKHAWPNQQPIGQCISLGVRSAPCAIVIGVVGDRRPGVRSPIGASEVYLPLGSDFLAPSLTGAFPGRELAVRLNSTATAEIGQALRAAALAAIPTLTNARVRTGAEYFGASYRTLRFVAGTMGIFGAIAIIVAAFGVYGSTAQALAQRTHELSIRKALGATALELIALVVRESLEIGAAGLVIGSICGMYAAHVTRSLLFGVSSSDPRGYAVAAVALILSTSAAALYPAIRATSLDAASLLRGE